MRCAITPAAVFAALVVCHFCLITGGCHSKPADDLRSASVPLSQPVGQQSTSPQPEPSLEDVPAAASAQALSARTQNWAREMEPWLNQRARREPAGSSLVNPGDLRLGPAEASTGRKTEPAVTVVPVAETVKESTPANANQGVALVAPSPAPAAMPMATNAGAAVPRLVADSGSQPMVTTSREMASRGGAVELDIQKHLKNNPRDAWAHLDFQLFQFIQDKPAPQLEALASLSAEDREVISAVMDGLSNFRAGIRADGNMLMSRKVKPLLDMADRLRVQADLVIPTVSLCTRVDGYGVYEPLEPARFTAMREHPIIIYCEVENFASQMNGTRQWETRLSQEVVLYTETGLPVWQDKSPNIVDLARHRRHDFFLVKKTRFPSNITIGRYLLKVTVVDQQASRVAEATIPVQFVAHQDK